MSEYSCSRPATYKDVSIEATACVHRNDTIRCKSHYVPVQYSAAADVRLYTVARYTRSLVRRHLGVYSEFGA